MRPGGAWSGAGQELCGQALHRLPARALGLLRARGQLQLDVEALQREGRVEGREGRALALQRAERGVAERRDDDRLGERLGALQRRQTRMAAWIPGSGWADAEELAT